MFALTNVILERTEAYRFGFSPPFGMSWPASRFSDWPSEVEKAAREWIVRLERGEGQLSEFMLRHWSALCERMAYAARRCCFGKGVERL